MKKKILRTAVISLVLTALLATSALATTIGGGTVKTVEANSSLNLRSEPSTGSPARLTIPNGGFLLVEEKAGNWYKVLYNGVEGYVSADYVSFAETLDGKYSYVASVSGDNVRFRAGASTSAGILGSMNTGTPLTVIGVSGAWVKVVNASGTTGFVHSDYLDCRDEDAPASTLSTGEQIVETARQYLGSRYVWGGMSPSGFDCSGFVNYVYKLYGYTMHRVAQDIYSNDGSYVEKANLQPGDLVFFGYSAYSVSHVGMYIGDGQFIHSSSSDTGVIISELSSNYYTRMYVGAKRILEG